MNLFAPLSAALSSPLSAALSAPAMASSADPNALGTADSVNPSPLSPSFSQTLQNAFSKVNDMQVHAGAMTKAYALGQTSDIHSVMIAGEQATIALQMTTQIRNKVVDAYQEIMRISM